MHSRRRHVGSVLVTDSKHQLRGLTQVSSSFFRNINFGQFSQDPQVQNLAPTPSDLNLKSERLVALTSRRQACTHSESEDSITKRFIFPSGNTILTPTSLALELTTQPATLLSTTMEESSTCKEGPKILQVSFKINSHLMTLLLEPLAINVRKNIPGPGHYGQGIEINKYGVYRLSTIENTRAAAWSPSKKRFEDDLRHKRTLPGPGDYYPSDQLAGQYLLSNFKSYGTRKYVPDAN